MNETRKFFLFLTASLLMITGYVSHYRVRPMYPAQTQCVFVT